MNCPRERDREPRPAPPPPPTRSPQNAPRNDIVRCPICGSPAIEKLEKWFCPRCKILIESCCE